MWEEVTKMLWNPFFFLKCTSNEIFVLNAFWQNWKKLDNRIFSGQFREILILKNYCAFASKRFSRRSFVIFKIFPIRKFQFPNRIPFSL